MKYKLLFLSFFLTQILSAQTFTDASLPSDFDGVYRSSIAFSDVDGDGDPDVLITGQPNSGDRFSKLYTNDGLGNFTEVTGTPFETVSSGSIAFADVDGDNDSDVLITGQKTSSEYIAKLYTNDGLGNFTEVTGGPFEGVSSSSIVFADVDGDNDSDVLIAGFRLSGIGISKLYTNDGTGNFSEMLDTPFEVVINGSIAFSDVDGDNDPDVLITGAKDISGEDLISKLYTNDGLGNFSEVIGTPFRGVVGSSIAFSDVDGDEDPDVLITGLTESDELISILYSNDGLGNFTEVTGTPFDGVVGGSIAFADVDGDSDPDVLVTGSSSNPVTFTVIAKLYTNDGLGNFVELTGTPFEAVTSSSIAFADVDGDTDPDLLITGGKETNGTDGISKLYLNDLLSTTDEIIPGFTFDLIPYPNPAAENHLMVDFYSTQSGFVNVKVYGLNGQLLTEQREFAQVGPQTITVEVGGLSAGNYFIQLDNGKRTDVSKFIIN